MANEVIRINPNRQLVGYAGSSSRQIRRIAAIAEVTHAGMEEIENLHRVTVSEATRGLRTIQQYEQTARDKQALARLEAGLCNKIGHITQKASDDIIYLLESLPPNIANTLWDDIRDLLDG